MLNVIERKILFICDLNMMRSIVYVTRRAHAHICECNEAVLGDWQSYR